MGNNQNQWMSYLHSDNDKNSYKFINMEPFKCLRQGWKHGRHAPQGKKLISLTQPEQHGSHCVQGNGTGLALLQGLTHH